MRRSDSGSWASGLRTHRMVMRPWRMLHPCLTMLLLALYRSRRQGGKELIRLQTRTSLSTTTGFDPRAVRAASGHSMSFTPDKMLMRVDRTSSRNILRCHWLIYPQMVIPQLKSCHSLQSSRMASCVEWKSQTVLHGRLHNHFGAVAPRDRRNRVTK